MAREPKEGEYGDIVVRDPWQTKIETRGRKAGAIPVEEVQKRSLELFTQGFSVGQVCAKIDRSRQTYELWRRKTPGYAEKVDRIRAKIRGDAPTKTVSDFASFRKNYLKTETFWHQHQWIDLLEGREPSNLHDQQVYHKGTEYKSRILINTPPNHGTAPAPDASPAVKAAWINRMKNNARSTFIVKALVGLVSPLAPQVSNQTQAESGFRNEFYAMVKKDGYATALQNFLKEHGTSAISYTVAHSQPTYHGAYIPYTNQAINAINGDLKPLLSSNVAAGAAFLIPQAQGPGDVQTIHSELIRNYLRQQDTPQQFLDAVDIALGNNAIDPALKVHEAALAQYANDPQGRNAENQNWSNYMKVQHLNNPTWYDYWASPERTNFAYQAWANLREIYSMTDKNGNPLPVTQTQQGQVVRQLLEDYANHALAMSQTTSSAQRTSERAAWKQYLQHEANTNPLAYSVINAVFDRLDSAGVTPNGVVA
ncbi:MAG: hypothetical protein KGL35_10190 [Bradyrhizobium sp.]|nr:hypothetical protein [Bradyrhizobium sp.]